MKLLSFLRRESRASLRRLALLAAVSGLANVLILVVINLSVQRAVEEAHSFTHLLEFLLVTGIYIVSQRYLLVETPTEIDRILHRIRVRIADKIRSCELEPLEAIGRSQIYACLSRETQTISLAAVVMVVGLQSGVVIFFAALYVAWLSVSALVVFAVAGAVAATIYRRRSEGLRRDFLEAMERENKVLDTLTHVLDGFVEIKMNPRRSDRLLEHLGSVSESASALRLDAKAQFAKLFILGQAILYSLVAAMVFVVPRLSETYDDVIVQAATAMLFLIGPVAFLVSSIQVFANTDAAIAKLEALEAELDAAIRRRAEGPEVQIAFRDIRTEGVVFHYHHTKSERPFTLGPLDLTLTSGETVFIVGGNGSGKSTFLRLLTALYDPDQGRIRINGKPLTEENLQAYRNLFSVIFSDFHLFDRLYGLKGVEPERVAALLEQMELAHKTSYRDGAFSTLDLSSGQRKRLAYVVSRLEDRPIYVFDEWAAGQDPEFRKKFYNELLPQLKQRGKTIVAVTHDDRYWSCADRVLKMEEGRFVDPGELTP